MKHEQMFVMTKLHLLVLLLEYSFDAFLST
jgi:hypothetical protein